MQDVAALRAVAEVLRDAEATGQACEPVRDLIGSGGIDAAYAVQTENIDAGRASSRRVVGRKIGLTSRAVQEQLGVDQPDFGVLFADMAANDGEPIAIDRLVAPRVEAEIAFVLDGDLRDDCITAADVLRATAFVVPAIEIVDSRIRDWDITIVDTIADNASAGRYVLGTRPTRLTDVDVRSAAMTMTRGDEEVSAGTGEACLGNPVNAVTWLANELVRRGDALCAGSVVLSGALGPMVPVAGPARYEAAIEGLGSVRAVFA